MEFKKMVLTRLWSRLAMILMVVISSQFLSIPAATALPKFNIDRGLLKAKLEDQYYLGLKALVGKAEAKANEISDQWKEDVTYQALAFLIRKNPKTYKIFKDQLKAGKSARQAMRKAIDGTPEKDVQKAIKAAGGGIPLAILKSVDKLLKSESLTIYNNLKKIAEDSRKRLNDLVKAADRFKSVPDQATFTKLIKEYGLSGSGIDSFEALEKRLSGIKSAIESPLGSYFSLYQTIYQGVEGKQLGDRATALFTLLDETAGNLPVLGKFVSLYMEMAKELLAATLRLRTAFAKWDMGCVGTATHGITISKSLKFTFPGTACPEGKVKGLYVDFSNPDVLYYWSGKEWQKAPDGKGGLPAIRDIMTLLKAVNLSQAEVKSGVPAAFRFYGVATGFAKVSKEAAELYSNIAGTWSRFKTIMKTFDISGPRAVEILEARSGMQPGFNAYLEKHFLLKKNRDIFIYRYVISMLGDGKAAQRHKDTLAVLKRFRPKVVSGKLELPEGIGLAGITPALDITGQTGVLVEQQQISLASRTYRIVMFGGPESRLEYSVVYGPFRSNVLAVENWAKLFIKHRAIIKAALGVKLALPERMEIDQTITIKGRIEPAVGADNTRFQLNWLVDGKPAGSRAIDGTGFSIALSFAKAGVHDFEVEVVDGNGIFGGERADLNVAFKVEVKLNGSPDDGGKLVATVKILGGSGAYRVNWRTDTGVAVSKDVGRNRFFQKLDDSGASKISWIDLTVFDKSSRIEVPVRVDVDGAVPMEVSLVAAQATLKNGESTKITASINAGLPEYALVFYAGGKVVGRQKTSAKTAGLVLRFDQPGNYPLRVIVSDRSGEVSEASTTVIVEKIKKPEPVQPKIEDKPAPVTAQVYSGVLDHKTYMQTFPKPAKKSLARETVNSKLRFIIDGTNVTGIFKGKILNLLYSDDVDLLFNCNASGPYNPDTEKIRLKLTCRNLKMNSEFAGFLQGKKVGDGFSGKWGFDLSRGGGPWTAVEQQ